MTDEELMALALEAAVSAQRAGNTPFGAVVARDGEVVATGGNEVVTACDPTAHGEVVAIRAACLQLRVLSLQECTLYTTCEPCDMCSGAIFATKIPRVVIGVVWADAPSYFNLRKHSFFRLVGRAGYQVEYTSGVLREECRKPYSVDAAK
jgi:tRNA(Arg) A34 adenosine deaminase TadA